MGRPSSPRCHSAPGRRRAPSALRPPDTHPEASGDPAAARRRRPPTGRHHRRRPAHPHDRGARRGRRGAPGRLDHRVTGRRPTPRRRPARAAGVQVGRRRGRSGRVPGPGGPRPRSDRRAARSPGDPRRADRGRAECLRRVPGSDEPRAGDHLPGAALLVAARSRRLVVGARRRGPDQRLAAAVPAGSGDGGAGRPVRRGHGVTAGCRLRAARRRAPALVPHRETPPRRSRPPTGRRRSLPRPRGPAAAPSIGGGSSTERTREEPVVGTERDASVRRQTETPGGRRVRARD